MIVEIRRRIGSTLTAAVFAAGLAFAGAAVPSLALAAVVYVGGAPMYPTKNIIQNAVNSKDHTTLVAAVKAAGLVQTLEGPGPFTVFAPTNAAFGKLPKGTVENLVKPENKETLTKILTYHVIPGRYTAEDLIALAKQNGGTASLRTVQGESLSVSLGGGGKSIIIGDAQGHGTRITIANVLQSNGVIHVLNSVLMP